MSTTQDNDEGQGQEQEVFSIHIGNTANYIASHLCNLRHAALSLSPSFSSDGQNDDRHTNIPDKDAFLSRETFFYQRPYGDSVAHVPRMVLFDDAHNFGALCADDGRFHSDIKLKLSQIRNTSSSMYSIISDSNTYQQDIIPPHRLSTSPSTSTYSSSIHHQNRSPSTQGLRSGPVQFWSDYLRTPLAHDCCIALPSGFARDGEGAGGQYDGGDSNTQKSRSFDLFDDTIRRDIERCDSLRAIISLCDVTKPHFSHLAVDTLHYLDDTLGSTTARLFIPVAQDSLAQCTDIVTATVEYEVDTVPIVLKKKQETENENMFEQSKGVAMALDTITLPLSLGTASGLHPMLNALRPRRSITLHSLVSASIANYSGDGTVTNMSNPSNCTTLNSTQQIFDSRYHTLAYRTNAVVDMWEHDKALVSRFKYPFSLYPIPFRLNLSSLSATSVHSANISLRAAGQHALSSSGPVVSDGLTHAYSNQNAYTHDISSVSGFVNDRGDTTQMLRDMISSLSASSRLSRRASTSTSFERESLREGLLSIIDDYDN